ncbi:MAG: mechanosensitive ion channel family protein [Candidatus Spyradosoma sp.]
MDAETGAVASTAAAVLIVIGIYAGCLWGIAFVVRRTLTLALLTISRRTKNDWDDTLCLNKFPQRLSHLIIAILCVRAVPFFFAGEPTTEKVLATVAGIYFAGACAGLAFSLLNTAIDVGENSPKTGGLPIKGFFQALKLLIGIGVGIWMLSIISDRSPMYFLSGLGAIMAVLLIVFRDTLLGLTAGFVIGANDLARKGDWIEIPSLNVDGDVVDVSLTTVKVRNWDKTISSVPAYTLISTSFKNWRGMEDAKGRRIKRAINIDMETIRFAKPEDLERWRKIELLAPYLERKIPEVESENAKRGESVRASAANARRLTNVGTFRAYCVAYLKAHANLWHGDETDEYGKSRGLTLIVRQLDPGATGLPLEIYVFTKKTGWVDYENIQSDVFDHLLSVMPEFGLRPFQEPSGRNFETFAAALSARADARGNAE